MYLFCSRSGGKAPANESSDIMEGDRRLVRLLFARGKACLSRALALRALLAMSRREEHATGSAAFAAEVSQGRPLLEGTLEAATSSNGASSTIVSNAF